MQKQDLKSVAHIAIKSMKTLLLVLLTLLAVCACRADIDWPQLQFSVVATNLASPVGIYNAGDGSGRLFVVEQHGTVRILSGTTFLQTPFLDVRDRVSTGTERGLLGLAFPPGYSSNSHFYVDYTRSADGATVISRFQLTADPNAADTNSEQILKVIAQPFANHNGGQLVFGPDGYLYIGMGDGGYNGTTGDPFSNAQNKLSLLGKLLRIDVESGASPYAVPPSNPFYGNTNYAPEIWALGLRNPWRFSFDRGTGDLYIGDVGHFVYEEVDFQPAGSAGGQNYGWRMMEGPAPYKPITNFDTSALTPPITYYDHTNNGVNYSAAVTGGFVYRGPEQPRMNGVYFFGDYVSGQIWAMKYANANWQRMEVVPRNLSSQSTNFNISSFGEDEQGNLYLADYSRGRIYQIQDNHQVWAPTFSPTNGVINDDHVQVSCATTGVTIHYTTNGVDPTELDPAISSGATIQVSAGITNKARAFRPDLSPSPVTTAIYGFKAATPTFSPAPGLVSYGTLVSITTATPNATIYYTTNNSIPTNTSLIYTGPITISNNVTFKAKAARPNFTDSAVQTATYQLPTVAMPTFNPASGQIMTNTAISITTVTSGADIYYTLDGSVATTNSIHYTGPIYIAGNLTLSAIAVKFGYNDSPVRSNYYPLIIREKTVVTTIAGDGTAGYRDGDGILAQFNSPCGICVDDAGNLYVADTGNYRIRKIAAGAARTTTTFAGSGVDNRIDGTGTNAQFRTLVGLCRGPDGTNLFAADRDLGNPNGIRRITPDGVVSTFATWPGPGSSGGLWQIDVDPNGNFYVGDYESVAKIDPATNITSFVPRQDNWGLVIGVAVDTNGIVFAASDAHIFKAVPGPSGTAMVSLFAGTSSVVEDGPVLQAGFARAIDTAFDRSGNLFVCDTVAIRKITTNGVVSTFAGTGIAGFKDGPGDIAQFNATAQICVDTNGNIYVADSANHRIRRVSIDLDGDGIPDFEEPSLGFTVGVDDRTVDSDGDGQSNADEYVAGTDPFSSASVFKIKNVTNSGSDVVISWDAAANRIYELKSSTNLISWQSC